MEIKIEKNHNRINTVEQWFQIAPPKESKQWKHGRSAMEMARFALSEEFPIVIADLISEMAIMEKSFTCEPEAKTTFNIDMGISGPRNHDLLMVGDDTIIGIEAKVSEAYDKLIKVKKKDATENMNKRLKSFFEFLYGKDCFPKDVDDLYYQLFSATIGTIQEAIKQNKRKAIVLFLTFVGDVAKESKYDNNVSTNEKAFKDFCNTLGLGDEGGKLMSVPGIKDAKVECWIKKVKVEIKYDRCTY